MRRHAARHPRYHRDCDGNSTVRESAVWWKGGESCGDALTGPGCGVWCGDRLTGGDEGLEEGEGGDILEEGEGGSMSGSRGQEVAVNDFLG